MIRMAEVTDLERVLQITANTITEVYRIIVSLSQKS